MDKTIENQEVVVEGAEPTMKETKPKSDKEIKTESLKKKYQKYKDWSDNKRITSKELRVALADDITEAISNLPTEKYLKQEITFGPNDDIYVSFINRVFDAPEFVEAGMGVEYVLTQGTVVNTLDENMFVPDTRYDIDNYTYATSVTMPRIIDQNELSIADWRYVSYFLSGKIDELANLVRTRAQTTMTLKKYHDCFMLLKEAFQKVYKKPLWTATNPTNHMQGTATNTLDAIKELKDFIFGMLNHNQIYHFNDDPVNGFTGYNNATNAELIKITTKEVYNNITKLASTFLNDTQLKEFADLSSWVILPDYIFNPTDKKPSGKQGQVNQLSILWDEANNERVKGCVFVVQKTGMKRIYNIDSVMAEFFPKNLTTQVFVNYRGTESILGWTQVAVFHNPALEAPWFIPVEANPQPRASK